MADHQCPRHTPGTVTCYVNCRCRCDACRAAHGRYTRRLRHDHACGRMRLVDPTGTRRRLRALHAIGWDWEALGERLGTSRTTVWSWGARSLVTITTDTTVRRLYAELSDMPRATYGARRARLHAQKLGWAPPIAWDDDTIDDPDAQPAPLTDQRTKAQRSADRLADVVELLDAGESPAMIAARLDISAATLQRWLHRLGRRDLASHFTGEVLAQRAS